MQPRSLTANLDRCHEQFNQPFFEAFKSTKDRWKFINNIRKPMKVSGIKILTNSFGDTITDPCKIANLQIGDTGRFQQPKKI